MEEKHARIFFIILGIVLAGAGYRYWRAQKRKSVF